MRGSAASLLKSLRSLGSKSMGKRMRASLSMEKETGKPIISNNQATMWYASRRLGIRDLIKRFGRLLEKY